MIASAASLLIPLALTTSFDIASPSFHRDIQAFVTGYNTVPGQTDSTPCIAASGADICGRRDAVACPRQISFGTTVEIRGVTYVCEDRLAKKYDNRFDISCDKDVACPYQVAGWATVKVYDTDPDHPVPPIILADTRHRVIAPIQTALRSHLRVPARVRPLPARTLSQLGQKLAAGAVRAVTILRGRSRARAT